MQTKSIVAVGVVIAALGLCNGSALAKDENYRFVTCSGFFNQFDASKDAENVSLVSDVFHTTERNNSAILKSFGKFVRANYPAFTELHNGRAKSCHVWDYETKRRARDKRNDHIAETHSMKIKVIKTLWEY